MQVMALSSQAACASFFTERRPFFYANAHEKDFVPLKPAEVAIADARGRDCSLDREGFTLVEHKSAVTDLTDLDAVAAIHRGEIAELLKRVTGCDEVVMTPFGILRFSEKSGANAAHDNSHPARFVHVDTAKEAAAAMREKTAPAGRTIARSAQYNVWRSLAGGTQDVPLGLCAYPSVAPEDLLDCDAIFDPLDGSPEWGFPNYLLAHNPAHRWWYFSNMTRDEVLLLVFHDSRRVKPWRVPHTAFRDRSRPQAHPRESVEFRSVAYFER